MPVLIDASQVESIRGGSPTRVPLNLWFSVAPFGDHTRRDSPLCSFSGSSASLGTRRHGRCCRSFAVRWHERRETTSTRRRSVLPGLVADRWTGHDCTEAVGLLEGFSAEVIVADKAYDADALIDCIEDRGAPAVIPPRANRREPRNLDHHRNRDRNLIERFFCRMKHFRRIATRYDKLSCRFSAFVAIVAAFIWPT